MAGILNIKIINLIARFRKDIQEIFEGYLKIKMQLSDLSEETPEENTLNILFNSDTSAGDPSPEAVKAGPEPHSLRRLVGKPWEFQHFMNKEGPSYDEEFMLDLEFNYDHGICTIHHINLPLHIRGRGVGGCIVEKTEHLAHRMGMKVVYVPAEHRATAFWIKKGYQFNFQAEQTFYEANSGRSNIYIAYDLRKHI